MVVVTADPEAAPQTLGYWPPMPVATRSQLEQASFFNSLVAMTMTMVERNETSGEYYSPV